MGGIRPGASRRLPQAVRARRSAADEGWPQAPAGSRPQSCRSTPDRRRPSKLPPRLPWPRARGLASRRRYTIRRRRRSCDRNDRALAVEAENRELRAKVKALQKEHGLFEQVAGVVREVVQPLPLVQYSVCVADGPLRDATSAGDQARPAISSSSSPTNTPTRSCPEKPLGGSSSMTSTSGGAVLPVCGISWLTMRRIHLPRHAPERLWIFKLGDSVNGDIHGHGPKNHFPNTIKSAIAVGDAEAQFVQSLIPYFSLGVHVVGVSGNHPRRSEKKDYEGPHDNFDYLVGVQMATRLQGEIHAGRCSVTLPESGSAYVEVRHMLWGLSHGDDTTGYTGLPWVGFDRRNNRVQTLLGRVDRRADAFCYGHYHTPAAFPSAGAVSFHSGCWTAADPYAINRLAAGGEPQQTLVVVGDKPRVRGILLPIPLYTRQKKPKRSTAKGSTRPSSAKKTRSTSSVPRARKG